MKAYHVHDKESDREEAHHEIVFAETAAQAKYKSEAYINGTPWTDISATRDQAFDQYANTRVIPRSAYIDAGWVYECDGCNSHSANIEIDEKVYCEFCVEEMGIEHQEPKAIESTESAKAV